MIALTFGDLAMAAVSVVIATIFIIYKEIVK